LFVHFCIVVSFKVNDIVTKNLVLWQAQLYIMEIVIAVHKKWGEIVRSHFISSQNFSLRIKFEGIS